MVAALPFPGILPLEPSSYHALRTRARVWSDLSESGYDVTGEQLELAHDVAMGHSGKEHAADQMGHAVLLDEAADRRHALRGTADDEAVLHQLVEIGRDRAVDERVAPSAGVLSAIGHHDVLLGELACLPIAVGDDEITGQWPLGDGFDATRRLSVLEELALAVQQSSKVCRRTWQPVVSQRPRPFEREIAPAPDPDGRMRLRHRLRLDPALDGVVPALELDPLLGPQPLHDGELLLEPGAALLEIDAVERELVGFV